MKWTELFPQPRLLFETDGIDPRLIRDRRSLEPELSQACVDQIAAYLKNPTQSGLWRLHLDWQASGGISDHVLDLLAQVSTPAENGVLLTRDKRRTKLSPDRMHDLQETVQYKSTFLFTLFSHLASADTENEAIQLDGYYRLIVDFVDLESIKARYADAFNWFKDRIYFPGFHPVIRTGQPLHTRTGFLFLLESSDAKSFVRYYSLQRECLHDVAQFFHLVGKATTASLRPVFSPEDEVFLP